MGFFTLQCWLAIYALLSVGATCKNATTVFSAAQWSAGTTVAYPSSADFANATERWSIYDSPTYSVAISPATEEDVRQAVQLSTSNRYPFLATGGRHGYTTTLGYLQDGVAIDLSKLNTVNVDQSAGTLTIGPGVRFRDIYNPVFEAGYELQIVTASCPGVIGATLGAGEGLWNGVHGLIIDALISLRVVTANGTIVEASKTSNAELFWGMRGAGANFGVVVSATYQLQEQVNQGHIFSADFVIPPERRQSYFQLLETYSHSNMSDKLSISTFLGWNATTGVPQVTSNWAYLGPEEEGREAFQPVLDLDPIISDIQAYTWENLIQTVAGGSDAYLCLPDQIRDVYGVNTRNISASTYEAVFQKASAFFTNLPDARGGMIRMAMLPNQATVAVPDDETAYPWRDTLAYVDIVVSWPDTNSTTAAMIDSFGREVRDDFAATSGYPSLAVYINIAHGDESLEAIYGASKLPRLAALKRTWDPQNAFAFEKALPTHYP
ncbi:putative FAD-binding PCMH-type domain-containing protein [Seiridium cardinale]